MKSNIECIYFGIVRLELNDYLVVINCDALTYKHKRIECSVLVFVLFNDALNTHLLQIISVRK